MFKTRFILPATLSNFEVAVFGEALSDLCFSHSALRLENHHQSDWAIELMSNESANENVLRSRLQIVSETHNIPLPADIDFEEEEIEDRNWLEYSYQQFEPFNVGSFFIYGAHFEGEVPPSKIGLQVDATTAFGSGEHGTTKGCLHAMDDMFEMGVCPWNILDMGTGSGILAIAAWKLWHAPVFAVDNDPESIRVTERHVEDNGLEVGRGKIETFVNEGFAGDRVQKKGPYELVIANILPGPLKAMAQDLESVVDDNGYVILSGILNDQVGDVLSVYEQGSLRKLEERKIDGWSTLVLHKAET
ncbi:MAG: 50S ribosomal protein L11 methyltransferase [Alphaproteobacteria bacterium]|nr:50S ribosomal protein L11 methyltransferase [Alphaproteobacteria bacterium]